MNKKYLENIYKQCIRFGLNASSEEAQLLRKLIKNANNVQKIYLVMDQFTGTFGDQEVSVAGVYDDELIAQAVANRRYAHSVDDREIQTECPEYAQAEYKKLKRKKRI